MSNGTQLKDAAIGVAVFAGIAGAVFLFVKGRQVAETVSAAVDVVSEKVSETKGFLTGTSQEETLGTRLFDIVQDSKDGIARLFGFDDRAEQTMQRARLRERRARALGVPVDFT